MVATTRPRGTEFLPTGGQIGKGLSLELTGQGDFKIPGCGATRFLCLGKAFKKVGCGDSMP